MKKTLVVLLALMVSTVALAQDQYDSRRAIIVNVCPHVKLLDFRWNIIGGERTNDFNWSGTSDSPVIAFEIVLVRFDPFNRQLISEGTIFPGHERSEPLKKDEHDSSGTKIRFSDNVYTQIAYVSNVRLADGTLWRANFDDVVKSIAAQVPDIIKPTPPEFPKKGGG